MRWCAEEAGPGAAVSPAQPLPLRRCHGEDSSSADPVGGSSVEDGCGSPRGRLRNQCSWSTLAAEERRRRLVLAVAPAEGDGYSRDAAASLRRCGMCDEGGHGVCHAPPPPPVVVGNMVYVSGIGPLAPEATSHVAKIGSTEDKEKDIIGTADGKAAARACALTMMAVLRAQLGSLNHIKRLVNAKGFVNCTLDYTEQPEVTNGFSENFMRPAHGGRGRSTVQRS